MYCADSFGDVEFEIIKNPKRRIVADTQSSLTTEERDLKPLWVDADNEIPLKTNHPTVLNIHAQSSCKRKSKRGHHLVGSVIAQDFGSVVHYGEKAVSDPTLKMCRLSDANMERLSCAPLSSVEFNKKYQIFMSASVDTTLSLFNFVPEGSKLMADHTFQKFPISSAKFTLTGENVLLAGRKHYFKVLDLNINKVTYPKVLLGLHYGEKIISVQISPLNTLAAFSVSNNVCLVDLRNLEKVATVTLNGATMSHCFSPDGNLLNTFSSKFL